MGLIRLLFLSDTHLGFDYPFQPRVLRRRRGEDFFSNFERALAPAFSGRVDAVIHGGDLLFRSRVPARLVDMALAPLKELADRGTPVFVVPGNHERSRIPFRLLGMHPRLHIFDFPRTFHLETAGFRLALAGFPYQRGNIRRTFPDVLASTGWREEGAGCNAALLCVHHCFEGATVGPGDHMFRDAEDVIHHRDVPPGIRAILSGHIHRRQALTRDLRGYPLKTPVLYPGSIERTSFAERDETKGFLLLKIQKDGSGDSPSLDWRFTDLPARPMVRIPLQAEALDRRALDLYLRGSLGRLDPESIVQLQVKGTVRRECLPLLGAAHLRRICPPDMNITVGFPFGERRRSR
jgi:exonuclease SbcD